VYNKEYQMSSSAEPEDFLTEDPEISSQKYVLLSFLSPEKVLARKDLFMFENFLKVYEVDWKVKNLEKFLGETVKGINDRIDKEVTKLMEKNLNDEAELVRTTKVPVDSVLTKYADFVRENAKAVNATTIQDSFEDFHFKMGKELEDKFYAKNSFQTTVRGLKVRGVYGSQEEAVSRSKKLQRNDPHHNIFVGEVGKWLPWDPNPKDIAEQEYAEDELNQLMKGYKENQDAKDKFYNENPSLRKKDGDKSVNKMFESSVQNDNKSLFDGPADLAMERKSGAKKVVNEVVKEAVNEVVKEVVKEAVNEVVKELVPDID